MVQGFLDPSLRVEAPIAKAGVINSLGVDSDYRSHSLAGENASFALTPPDEGFELP
jgi:hypothetical protein